MAEQKFKPGDVVQLKSGGPEMTVRGYKMIQPFDAPAYPSDTEVECEWFDDKNQRQKGTFNQDTLEAVPDVDDIEYPAG